MKKFAVGLFKILSVAVVGGAPGAALPGWARFPKPSRPRSSFASDFQVPETMGLPADAVVHSSPIYRSNFTRRPEGLGGKGPLAALLVGHRPLRVCSLLAPCQSNPSLPNRTPSHFQTGSQRKPPSIFLSPNSLSLRSIMEGPHCDLGPLESRLAAGHCDGSP